jgi:hypothetical protein
MTRIVSFEVITSSPTAAEPIDAVPADIDHAAHDPAQWHQAVGIARQACARIFRDGGTAADALRTFGIAHAGRPPLDWSRAVHLIAESLCAPRLERAA